MSQSSTGTREDNPISHVRLAVLERAVHSDTLFACMDLIQPQSHEIERGR